MSEADVARLRVDKYNNGRLLNTEIARFIREADIIVADLTNERPNCYLEVGYAMGLGKFESLLLCARADHKADRPNRARRDPKVHFDLGGYDFLYWEADQPDQFRAELTARISRRLGRMAPAKPPARPWSA